MPDVALPLLPGGGFCVAGVVVAVAVLAPTMLLLVAPPRDVPAVVPRVSPALTGLERAGQIGCLVLPALSGRSAGLDGWLVLVVLSLAAYYALWARYLRSRRYALLYAAVGPVPVPMAVLPVVTFLATAAWLGSWPTAVAAVVLAVGHLGASATTARGVAG